MVCHNQNPILSRRAFLHMGRVSKILCLWFVIAFTCVVYWVECSSQSSSNSNRRKKRKKRRNKVAERVESPERPGGPAETVPRFPPVVAIKNSKRLPHATSDDEDDNLPYAKAHNVENKETSTLLMYAGYHHAHGCGR